MPSKLRKAIGAVKDQTSISLAKVTNAANLEVTILKATTHDKSPIEERYINEIVQLVSSDKVYAAACAHSLGKRLGKTRNWVVALKSLMIVLRIFQDGDPYFPREVFHAMKRGAKILNISNFRDDSNSSPWDYTAFVRTFALYLDERLECFLTGKLQRRFRYHQNRFPEKNNMKLSNEPGIKDMKPTMVLDRIIYWQRLLDRAIGTRPTGSSKMNRLVQISFYAVVQESFDLYRDISDGLSVILDSFFDLPHSACLAAFNAYEKSHKQFDELCTFYSFCANLGIGRSYEYPSVQLVSKELMETLQEFLKDQAGNSNGSNTTKKLGVGSSSLQDEASNDQRNSVTLESFFECGSDFESQCTSLEDLMSATDAALSPTMSLEQDGCSEEESEQDDDKRSQDEFGSACYSPKANHHASLSSSDIVVRSDEVTTQNEWEQQENTKTGSSSNDGSTDCWELVLAETVTAAPTNEATPKLGNEIIDPFATLFDQPSVVPQLQSNPFLEDIQTVDPNLKSQTSSFENVFHMVEPTFKAISPTFCAQDPLALTFPDQSSSSMTNLLDLIFGDMNPNEMVTMAPTFRAQESAETNMTVAAPPTSFHIETSNEIVNPSSYFQDNTFSLEHDSRSMFQEVHTSSYDTSIVPIQNFATTTQASSNGTNIMNPASYFQDNTFALENGSTAMFQEVHNSSYDTSIVPIFQDNTFSWENDSRAMFQEVHNSSYDTSIVPAFSMQNLNTTEASSNAAQNPNVDMVVPLAFGAENLYSTTTMTPTFNATNCDETTWARTQEDDDPFGAWSTNAKTIDQTSDVPIQDQTLFLQQQLWLEQQNKIIAKRLSFQI